MRRAPGDWIWAPYLSAFAEAGMVGACADWFAVVALFRRPLGLPIPHTAVVPENKRRIGAAMGRFITHASPSYACLRLTLSVSRRDGSRTSATRRRLRGQPDAPFRTRSISSQKRRSTNGSLSPRGAGSRRSPRHRLPPADSRSCGRRERARRCSIMASILSRRRLSATRQPSSGMWRKSLGAGSPNGSTT
jgi:hypothetical protein